jgi:hypothetical protein
MLEKEDCVARHQSGHNSGVIHSGVYYKPGSMKARLCVSGAAAMVEFCREHGIAHEVCGKVVGATNADELHAWKNRACGGTLMCRFSTLSRMVTLPNSGASEHGRRAARLHNRMPIIPDCAPSVTTR